jgi:transcriptional regulator with XRE-family HTH domain
MKANTSKKRPARNSINLTWLHRSSQIASKIMNALATRNMTQAELANRLGVSRQHISKIIKGQENLTLESIAKIEQVLKVVLISVPRNEIGSEKIRPLIYHSFEEKRQLEKNLSRATSKAKRKAVSLSLMSIFHDLGEQSKRNRKRFS